MNKSRLEILNKINEFETKENIELFNSEYGNLWPLFKFEILRFYIYNRKPFKKKNYMFRVIGSLRRLLISIYTYKFTIKRIVVNNSIDELWISNPVRRLGYDKEYNKYIDPYFNKLSSENALMIEKNHFKGSEYINNNLEKNSLILNIEPDYLCFLIKNINKINLNFNDVVKKYSLSLLSDFFPNITTYDFFLFVQDFVHWHNYYSYFFDQFPKLKKVVYIAYGSTDNLAINAVSKIKNIETVDLQHGVQTEYHTEYSRWGYLTKNIINLFPTSFYVFSNKEKDLLNKTFESYCGIKVVGDLALEKWLNNNKSINKKNIVLVSLQNTIIDKNNFIYDFLSYVNNNFPRLEVVFREHPRHKHLKDDFNLILTEKHILYKWDTNPDVYNTLYSAILNITSFSSVVEDAINLNVPSFVIDRIGGTFYKEHIENTKLVKLILSKDAAIKEFVKIYSKPQNRQNLIR